MVAKGQHRLIISSRRTSKPKLIGSGSSAMAADSLAQQESLLAFRGGYRPPLCSWAASPMLLRAIAGTIA